MTNLISITLNFDEKPIPVGRLAIQNNHIYFEYLPAFLKTNLLISPFKLPLKPGVQSFSNELFDGLPGVFNDSLPDGWGRLLLDRLLRGHGLAPAQLSPLDRLAYVGPFGMGALVYEPHYKLTPTENIPLNLDQLATYAHEILEGDSNDVLDELLALNGSSAGARPKALIGVNEKRNSIIHGAHDLPEEYTHWIVKFTNSLENIDSGAIEFVYSQMAKNAGVKISEAYLFPAKKGPGYFATKRFDRDKNKRLHLHSACGLLHSNFRTPSLDYEDLIKATMVLTKDIREAKNMFRLAVFNVLAHNRDDHSKNISFLMDESGKWALAPAYDLTFSFGPGGEQSTMVMGEGKNPSEKHLIQLGQAVGFDLTEINAIIKQTLAALSKWNILAKNAGVSKTNIKEIEKVIG